MSKKRIWQILGASSMSFVLVLGFSVFIDRDQNFHDVQSRETPQTITVSLIIEDLYAGKPLSVSSGDTVLEVLQALDAEDSRLRLTTKEYSGLGILIESMNGKTNGTNDEYWQYKVGGVMPQIGADKLELKDRDSVEWYFDKSEF